MELDLTLHGIVLSAMPVGDYDKRLSILTKERGKISAFARGARRPKSQLLATANPFAYGSFEAYQGRDSYTIHRADIDSYFTEITNDYEKVWLGYYFLEMADYFATENTDEAEWLALLLSTLKAMTQGKVETDLIRLVYEFKTFVLNGDYPDVFSCVMCGNKEELDFFSLEKRGCICAKHSEEKSAFPISSPALYTLQFIAATPPSKLFTFRLKDSVMEEVSYIISSYRRRYIAHSFKSEEFLALS